MTQHSAGFTPEQQEHLAKALVKLNLHRLVPSGAAAATAEPENVHGTLLEDLCKEELAKYNLHPLDMWRQLEGWEEAGVMAEGLDQFLLRHHGYFNVEPNSQGYMMRLRTAGGVLSGDQMIALGNISEDLAGGYAHVTTRGSVQMREIMPGSVIPMIERLGQVGLTAQGTGADSARNLTASPTAGIDADELINLAPLAKQLSTRILRTRELQGLPRKFNISFDNAGSISCLSDTNDIGFLAVKVGENAEGVEPGIWCRIHLGGITGHCDFARDTGMVCRPEHAVDIGEAMLRVFVDHGIRSNRGKARLKYVLDDKGFAWFCDRTTEKLAEMGSPAVLVALSDAADAPRPAIKRQAHIGVHPQAQAGLNYVGVALEVGRLSGEQMRALGRLANQFGSGEIRLTVWQNPMIIDVPDANVAAILAELEAQQMTAEATAFAAGAVACTGRWGCKFAAAYTKQDATRLVRHLEERFTLETPINIHLTGCNHSCAQHYIGDIGLIGAAAPGGGEGYNILLGGGSDQDQGLARPLCGPVAADDILGIIEAVVAKYLEDRTDGETFLAYTRRLDDDALAALAPAQTAAAA